MAPELSRAETDKKIIQTGTFLPCYCPHCQESLIEEKKVVFDILRKDGERGKMSLSPYLNVFETASTIYLAEGEQIEDMFCPHCGHSLKEIRQLCKRCRSNIVRFWVRPFKNDVDFYICLRKDCHWHGLSEEARKEMELAVTGFQDPKDQREMIRTGTKLRLFCPTCNEDLVHGEDLIIHVKDRKGNRDILKLSPYLNVFRSESSLAIPPGDQVADLICPECDNSLWVDDKQCGLCNSRAAKFRMRVSSYDADFYICMRNQCHWHGLSEQDCRKIILDDSNEW